MRNVFRVAPTHAPLDCDCVLGVAREGRGRTAAITATPALAGAGVLAPATGSLVLTGAAALAWVVVSTGRYYLVRYAESGRAYGRCPAENCASREHAPVSTRIERAVAAFDPRLVRGSEGSRRSRGVSRARRGSVAYESGYRYEDEYDDLVDQTGDPLESATESLLSTLGEVRSRGEYLAALPAGEVARVLALLEDHLPASYRLFLDLTWEEQHDEGEGSARTELARQFGVARTVLEAAVSATEEAARAERERVEEAGRLEREGHRRALAEHGRVLDSHLADRTAPAPVERSAPALDLASYLPGSRR